MDSVVGLFRSWPRATALALMAAGLGACSAETTRFNDGTYRNNQGEVTGSIPSGQGAPVARVESRPLPQTSQAPQQYAVRSAPPASVVSGPNAGGPASYTPGAPRQNSQPAPIGYDQQPAPATYTPGPEFTGSVVAPSSVVRKPAPQGHWTWEGGTAIVVSSGETVEGIARRYNVPASAILNANNLSSPNAIQAGQRLVIPRFVPADTVAAAPPAPNRAALLAPPRSDFRSDLKPAPKLAPVAAPVLAGRATGTINSGVHVVAPGETLTKIAHHYGKSLAEIAKANNIPSYSKVGIGDRIVIPGVRTGSIKSESQQTTAQLKPVAPTNKDMASTGPVQSASMVTPAADTPVAESPVKAAADATPGFRWPVRGRIIAAFGPKPNGQQNDGINVAVPENTPIKAAEDGVVAYAGNELKGYGNLVLVRHPNGYVTAYAHAKELLVKRGDAIKRGQVIAKSGQSGNVDAPQLHFEVRKGSSPVDPMQFLNGA